MLERNWRVFWMVAGGFNIFFGLFMLVDYQLFYQFIGAAGMHPVDPSWMRMTAWVIVIFGFGYCAVSRNLHAHMDIVIIGAIGKVAVWSVFALPHILGAPGENTPWQMGLLTCVDLAFAAVFTYYIFTRKKLLVAA